MVGRGPRHQGGGGRGGLVRVWPGNARHDTHTGTKVIYRAPVSLTQVRRSFSERQSLLHTYDGHVSTGEPRNAGYVDLPL